MNATPLLKLIFDRKHVAIGDMEASVGSASLTTTSKSILLQVLS